MDIKEVEKTRIEIGNAVYQSTRAFDIHEHRVAIGVESGGICIGNPHHKMQRLSQQAMNMFVESLISDFRNEYEMDSFGDYVLRRDRQERGFFQKYDVRRTDRFPNTEEKYFVLRVDGKSNDWIHVQKALKAYADSVRPENQTLADDLEKILAPQDQVQ